MSAGTTLKLTIIIITYNDNDGDITQLNQLPAIEDYYAFSQK